MADLASLLSGLKEMTVAEAAELSRQLEAKWGGLVVAPTLAVVGPDAMAPAAREVDDMSAEEWGEIKREAFKRFAAAALDSPEHHLAYVRERIAEATCRRG